MIFISFYLLFVRVEGVTDMDSRLNQSTILVMFDSCLGVNILTVVQRPKEKSKIIINYIFAVFFL